MSFWSDILNWFRPKPTPPIPPTPVQPPASIVRVKVDDGHQQIAASGGSLLLDWHGLTITATVDSGALLFQLPTGAPMGWGALLHTSVTGFQDFNGRIVCAPDVNVTVKKVVTLKPLRANGGFFETPDGPHTVIQTSAFKDLQLMIAGGKASLTQTYTQARELGYNDRRIFSTGKNDFVQLVPSSAYWPNTHRMLEYGAEFGQRFTFVVLVDVRSLGWSLGQQQEHWGLWGDVAKQHPNIRLSLANEIEQTPNITDPNQFQTIPGVLCSRGSHGGTNGGVPGLPFGCGVREPEPAYATWWDFEECHSNNQKKQEQEEQRVPAHLSMEMTSGEGETKASHVPAECSEMSRFPDQWAGYDPARLESVAFAIGQSSALLGAGSCFHSIEGRVSAPFVNALPYARKFAEGARSVPLKFQRGQYFRIDDPNYLRVYERRLGAESFVTRIPK